MKYKNLIIFTSILLLLTVSVFAQKFEWLPGSTYDSSIPNPESVLGYEIGTYITEHHQMVEYMHMLAASTDKVQIFKYGQSYERRNLYIVVIGSPQNMQRLEEIRKTIERLTDPRDTSVAEAAAIAKETPAIGWANFGTDGNENTALETSMQLAYQLAAGQDALTKKILDNVVVVINPCLSPDSLQRYAVWMKAVMVGKKGTADPAASEHRRDWLMDTNQNHFGIDVNRDAFALSTDVSRAAVEIMHHWNPQTWIDNHGTPNEYYFAPFASPINLNYPASHLKWAVEIGKNNARYFSRYGWTFNKDERYDLYYPGYFDSYPALNGAIAATYETDGGGNKGLIYELPDKSFKTLRDGAHHHFITNMSTLEVLANNRESVLEDYYNFRKTGMEEADKEKFKSYVLIPGNDRSRLNDLLELLIRHKFEIYKTEMPVFSRTAQTYFDRVTKSLTFPEGSYIIPLKQPQKRAVKTFLEPDPKMEAKFLEEVDKRRARNKKLGSAVRKESYDFYDVAAWALPVTYGIDAAFTEEALAIPKGNQVVARPDSGGGVIGGKAGYAYLFTYGCDGGAKLCGRLLQEGYNVALAMKEFKNSGRDFPKGTLFVRVERNPDNLHDRITDLAKKYAVDVYAVNTGWADSGISPGSGYMTILKKPRIMVLTHTPTSSTGFGSVWHLLEARYGLEFTAVRAEYFSSADLSRYNVIIFPDGSAAGYESYLGKDGVSRLKQWIQDGGTFVGIKGGAAFTMRKEVEFTDVQLINEIPAEKKKESSDKEKDAEKIPIEYIPGSIFKAKVNSDYYLGLGYPEEIAVQVRGNMMFSPSKKGANVVTFPQNSFMMGHIWDYTEDLLTGKIYLSDVPVGQGHVILFADDPTFRNYWRGLDRLFLNCILLSTAF
jgi:hypothetical protein